MAGNSFKVKGETSKEIDLVLSMNAKNNKVVRSEQILRKTVTKRNRVIRIRNMWLKLLGRIKRKECLGNLRPTRYTERK